jgi:prepilin-type N-terminal cleavage/methylation domain-containing protein
VRRAGDESGFTLVEVLVASLISLAILGVTLTAFTGLVR